ncbi:Exportin-6-A [Paragonimus heterotremus]|uniref:Exportin-6-A n=1 Tax=Paragonimus heterotremus TaxID=100268 RepID=A0A8J4T1X4_9TREM|nr:Exportin-6-A [Paragonimus heterotremus]
MTTDEASLNTLTNLLTEFYSCSVKPDRRKSIQSVLVAFEQTPTAWYNSLYYLFTTTDQQVALYCLGVVETTVVLRWSLLPVEHKSEICRLIHEYLFQRLTIDVAHFLIKKAAKVLACIACFDWPHAYPDFMEDVKAYIFRHLNANDLSRITLGFIILRVYAEQLIDPHELVSFRRRCELRNQLINETESLYSLLCHVGSSLCGNDLLTASGALLQTASITRQDSDLSTFFQSVFSLTESLLEADLLIQSELKLRAYLTCLECVCELSKLLPVDSRFQISLHSLLFICSLMATTNSANMLARISLCALTCFQELVDRKDLSADLMVTQLFHIFPIVQCHLNLITGDLVLPCSSVAVSEKQKDSCFSTTYNNDLTTALVADVQSQSSFIEYRLKLVDILRNLMTNFFCHLSDVVLVQGIDKFDPVQFLSSLHDFTFSSLDLESYFSCLQMWSSYFEFLHMRYFTDSTTRLPHRLSGAFVTFGRTLLSRLFYSEAASFLETLDEDMSTETNQYLTEADEDESTIFLISDQPSDNPKSEACEYRMFLRESLLTLNTLITLCPEELVNAVLARYHNTWNDYVLFIRSSDLLTSDQFIVSPKGQSLHRIHWALRDHATSTQTVGFLFEHLKFNAPNREGSQQLVSGQDFLQSLVYGLKVSHRIASFLPTVSESLIRSDLIEVIIQNLLTLHAIIVGNYLLCEDSVVDGNIEQTHKLVLTSSQRDSFVNDVLTVLESFAIATDPTSQSTLPIVIQLCAARLLNALLCSPVLSAVVHVPINLTSCDANSGSIFVEHIRTILKRIFVAVCDADCRAQWRRPICGLLLRTFLQYLSRNDTVISQLPETSSNSSTLNSPTSLLSQYITNVFSPQLTPEQLMQNPGSHIVYLGFLNRAVLGLESSSGDARRLVYTVLRDSGLLDNLANCVKMALPISGEFTLMRLQFCTAYLTFFTTFTRVLSQSGSAVSAIPGLLAEIVKALNPATGDPSFPVPLIDCLVEMFILLSKNRRVFLSLIGDLLDLCHSRLLVGLGLNPFEDTEQGLTNLVCDAAQHNISSLQKLYELFHAILLDGFSFFFMQLSDKRADRKAEMSTTINNQYCLDKQPAFHRLMLVFTAVFHENQLNASLVRFVLDKLHSLHRHRKFYDLSAFNQFWLPEIIRRLLDRLVNKQHDSCKDSMINGLYHLVRSLVMERPSQAIRSSTDTDVLKGPTAFAQCFLPAYLHSLPFLRPSVCSSLLVDFSITPNDSSSHFQNVISSEFSHLQVPVQDH